MSTVGWGSNENVMKVYARLLELGSDTQHGAVACPKGTTPDDYPPPFPIVVAKQPIQIDVLTEDDVLCDLFYWVSRDAWEAAGF